MIDLYFRPTANGLKITIMLEETGLAHRLIPMSGLAGEQFNPDFLRISPNNKMPAIVDHAPADGGPPLALFESGAILMYLADKTGQFMPMNLRARNEALQWLMWQMAGLGPMSGQNGHFRHQAPAPADPYASSRYFGEVSRLYAVLDHRLRDRDYVAGDYTIVDMACHPWIAVSGVQGMDLDDFPHVRRWFGQVGEREAVKRAYAEVNHGPSQRLSEADHRRRYQQTAQLIRDAYARMDAEGS